MNRLFGLDLLRAIAIIFVLLSHSRKLLLNYFPALDFLKMGGFFGVELFFALSGFLIGGILIKNSQLKFNLDDLKKFWKRRWIRTLPNYYLFLFVNVLIISFFTKTLVFDPKFLIFAQNLWFPHPTFFGEAWSLAVEEWFYIIFPLLLLASLKIKNTKKITKRILYLAIIFIVTINLARFYYVIKFSPDWDEGIRKIVFCRLDSIMYGVICSYLYKEFPIIWNKLKWHSLLIGLGLFVLSVFLFFNIESNPKSIFMGTFYFSLTGIAAAMLIPFFTSLKCNFRSLNKIITTTSLISYSMYLIHNSIILVAFKVLFKPNSPFQAIILWIFYIIITYITSYAIYNYFEKPILKLRDRKLH